MTGNCATIHDYLEMELRYMDVGERGPQALYDGPFRGCWVTDSHVIYHHLGDRYAVATVHGTDLR